MIKKHPLLTSSRPTTSKKSPTAQLLAAMAMLAVAGTSSVYAANDLWIGNTNANFNTLTNWTGSVDPNGNTPQFGTAGSSGTTLNNDQVGSSFAGLLFNSGADAFTIGGNSFTLTGNITNNGANTQTINNAITLNNAGHTFAATSGNIALGGNFSGATTQSAIFTGAGTTTLSGTNAFNMNSSGGSGFYTFSVGSGNGTSPTAGNLSITGATTVDGSTGGTTKYWGYLSVIGNSNLTIQSGGSLAINTSLPTANNLASAIGQNATGTSTVTVNGSFSLNGNGGLLVGNNRSDATGVLTINSGGTATLTAGSTTLQDNRNTITLGNAGATGIINLNGGTLATGRQFVRGSGAGSATFNFNGGVLQAQADQTQGNGWFETATSGSFQDVTTIVKSGGAKIDTNGFTTNVNTVLAHDSGLGGTADGGLTKSGAGALTLGAANTYTGATAIAAGTLKIATGGSLANTSGISVATGATIENANGASITRDLTLAEGAAVTTSAASSAFAPTSLTLSGNLSDGWTAIALTNTAGSGLTKGGALTLTLSGITVGNYNLTSGSGFSGAFASANVNGNALTASGSDWVGTNIGGFNYTFTNSTNLLEIVAVPEPSTFAMLLGGVGILTLFRRRRRA